MNRIDARFAQLKTASRTALIPFMTAGDPSPGQVVELMHALVDSGGDLLELGVPFSDPMADGPVIQHASERAIAAGVGMADVLRWVGEFRQRDTATPVVLMGYLNPIETYGYERFAKAAVSVGVDGVLPVDCPWEESSVLAPLRAAGLRQILMAAPTTAPERLAGLGASAEGFLYYVSFAGITGAARLCVADVATRVAEIYKHTRVPVAVGFGVRDAESAKAVADVADAVVIGSALVEYLVTAGLEENLSDALAGFLAPIRAALDHH